MEDDREMEELVVIVRCCRQGANQQWDDGGSDADQCARVYAALSQLAGTARQTAISTGNFLLFLNIPVYKSRYSVCTSYDLLQRHFHMCAYHQPVSERVKPLLRA